MSDQPRESQWRRNDKIAVVAIMVMVTIALASFLNTQFKDYEGLRSDIRSTEQSIAHLTTRVNKVEAISETVVEMREDIASVKAMMTLILKEKTLQ